ncbi:macro domain-containing protein [Candidatus Magnetominusculus xianensis]|uniref:Appr-1-p processing protein n=1 Tax=Candidatus Magnetominusculus xianensis TaxID=1748249 RepID=A0ABR5SCY7_9BACT|nr:macro domain-containing protein [Candidatus Magnetominusculus xianensis]KWT82470.1 Appr-1-p processing protein [Candidatus Magnetominusculus xianensis]MBF0403190.1 macro domain-containing protein [Nitrospirota bacterium]
MELISEKTIGTGKLRLVKGDITGRAVDAIVNAANSHLQHGGGVAAAIVRKGGSSIQEESDKAGFTPVGTVAVTQAGKLPCKAVIHAVGPQMGEGDEDEKLKNAVVNSLKAAAQRGFISISMPAISSGIFCFPKDRCARILVGQSERFLKENPGSSVKIIEFCIYDDATLEYFKREFYKESENSCS